MTKIYYHTKNTAGAAVATAAAVIVVVVVAVVVVQVTIIVIITIAILTIISTAINNNYSIFIHSWNTRYRKVDSDITQLNKG